MWHCAKAQKPETNFLQMSGGRRAGEKGGGEMEGRGKMERKRGRGKWREEG